jgi:natural product precursor
MKKKFNTKLTLKKHTVADLVDQDMNRVKGGIQTQLINTCTCACEGTYHADGCAFTFYNTSCKGTICN